MNQRLHKAAIIFGAGMMLSTVTNAQQQLSFPGAEGWGKFTTGGRMTDESVGSNVYYVTTLDDYTSSQDPIEGSLRWALSVGDNTPRTILFKVSGTINLQERLKFSHPNVTIAGQSAPGGGICISGANIYVCYDNVIIRYVRFRAGDLANSNYSAIDIENTKNVIVDHCSFSWSMEENVTMYDNKYTTMQWCILSEPLYYSRHKKGERGYGSQWGGEHSTYHHNLLAHCVSRAPRVNGARDKSASGHDFFVDSEIAYNVIYNWGNKGAVYGGELEAVVDGAYSRTFLFDNYFKPGPLTNLFQERWFADCSHTESKASGLGQWFIEGNMFETNEYKNDKNKGDHSKVNADNWIYTNPADSKKAVNLRAAITEIDNIRLTTQSASSDLTPSTAQKAYEEVVAKAGVWFPRLDDVDKRILAEAAGAQSPVDYGTVKVSSGTPTSIKYVGIINSQDDLKPSDATDEWSAWPDLSMMPGETLAVDTDGDGIPDAWETANGLDKNNAEDGRIIAENGYSNLENYLNSIVESQFTTSSDAVKGYLSDLATFYNPATRRIHFNIYAGVSRLNIHAISGELVLSHKADGNDEISVGSLTNGVYLLSWQMTDGSVRGEKIQVR